MKKPMTTEDLFNKIKDILEEKGKLPDILDYGEAKVNPVPITTDVYGVKNNLGYGGSEGIYLDLWIVYLAEDGRRKAGLGTFKTLCEDADAMHSMANLLADFIIEESAYYNANLDDFIWEGVNICPVDDAGRQLSWRCTCCDMETALEKKDELLKKYPQVVVRDNATRKEKIYSRED